MTYIVFCCDSFLQGQKFRSKSWIKTNLWDTHHFTTKLKSGEVWPELDLGVLDIFGWISSPISRLVNQSLLLTYPTRRNKALLIIGFFKNALLNLNFWGRYIRGCWLISHWAIPISNKNINLIATAKCPHLFFGWCTWNILVKLHHFLKVWGEN